MALKNKKIKIEKLPDRQTAGLIALFQNAKKSYVKFMTNLGAHIFHFGRYALYKAMKVLKKIIKYVYIKALVLVLKLSRSVKGYVLAKRQKISAYFKALSQAFSEKRNSAGIFPAVGLYVSTVGKSFWSRRRACITIFNYATPVICVVFLVNLIGYATNVPYGISVECNGKVVGYIKNEAVFDEAQKMMKDRITYVKGDKEIEIVPKLSVQKLSAETQVSDANQLTDQLISTSDVDLTKAYGFYINDQFSGAVTDKSKVEAALNEILNKFKTNNAGETVEFVDKFEFKDGLFLANGMVTPESIVQKLQGQKQVESYYTVVEGDAPSLIAQKVGIPYNNLKAMNPSIETRCSVGDKILINRAEPYASVRVKRTEEYDISLPFNTVSVNDASKYKGTQVVTVAGSSGTAHVKAEVSYVNNYEQSRTVLSQDVTKAPVDRKISIGTKSFGASQAAINASGSGMLWPAGGNGGYISQYFMHNGHKGIDIPLPYGTPVYAAADGVVSLASWYYGYGNAVILDHGSGLTTLYGHNSKLAVRQGQSIKKGDVIAYVGNTGQSEGNHIHFEVRYLGQPQNPLNFVSQR